MFDFEGGGRRGGDVLRFEGYGEGATLSYDRQFGQVFVTAADGDVKVIMLRSVNGLNADDYLFVG